MRDIAYVNPRDASDVKVPWELSRLQWLMPAGQAYLLSGDERYAEAVRAVLEDWIDAEPLRRDRQLVLHDGGGAADPELDVVLPRLPREPRLGGPRLPRAVPVRPLPARRLHAEAPRALRRQRQPLHGGRGRARLRGSVLRPGTRPGAVAGARVVAAVRGAPAPGDSGRRRLRGLRGVPPARGRAVPAAGALPTGVRARRAAPSTGSASWRWRASLPRTRGPTAARRSGATRTTPAPCRSAARRSRTIATCPGSSALAFDVAELRDASAGSRSEAFWLLGPAKAASLPEAVTPPRPPRSRAFPDGGFYVLRNEQSTTSSWTAARSGLAGRGGHGHNDCLSFEADSRRRAASSPTAAPSSTPPRSPSATASARPPSTTRRASTARR